MIRKTRAKDLEALYDLYRSVARHPGGLARLEDEITRGFIGEFLDKSLSDGLSLVKVIDDRLAGEIHAYRKGIFCFSHVLGDLTIVVSPEQQRKGVGRELFETFLDIVETEMTDISRIELIARESNAKAINFYRALGFRIEGEFKMRVKNIDGTMESDIPMAWLRKGKSFEESQF